jgi:hypothetical protein
MLIQSTFRLLLSYLYQIQYTLYALLTADDEESALILEGLNDMERQSVTLAELQQRQDHLRLRVR